jgi:hypothetical protein
MKNLFCAALVLCMCWVANASYAGNVIGKIVPGPAPHGYLNKAPNYYYYDPTYRHRYYGRIRPGPAPYKNGAGQIQSGPAPYGR